MSTISPTELDASRSERMRRARLLGCAERQDLVASFFGGAAADRNGGLGLGTAIAEFQGWEMSSGRIRDGGGSPWWSAINGLLLLDMADAARHVATTGCVVAVSPVPALPGPGIAGWVEFLGDDSTGASRAQGLLWSAHQDSIRRAAETCSALLAAEPGPERDFALLALAVVERAAQMEIPTDGSLLGQMTRSYFPGHYPIDARSVAELRSELAELGPSGMP